MPDNGYIVEFVLYAQGLSPDLIKSSLSEFGEGLVISMLPRGESEKGENFRIEIRTDDPTFVFDACAQLGRIKSVKVNEEEGG